MTGQAQIFQFDSVTGPTAMLIDVTSDAYGLWTNHVELQLPNASVGKGLTENDIIQYWGPIGAPNSYTNVIGGTSTVPTIDAQYVTVISPAST